MKRIIVNCVLFGLLITFLCVLYVCLFQVSLSALGILLAVLSIYGFCMEIGWKSAQELKKYEQKAIHFGLCDEDDPKILLHALLSLSSTYFCVLLALLIPLYTYEVWLITVLPCIIWKAFFPCPKQSRLCCSRKYLRFFQIHFIEYL